MSRRLKIASVWWPVFLLSIFAFSALAQGSTPAQRFAASPAVKADKCAVLVVDLSNGKVVDEHNADTPLVPASINKVVTIATTLSKTGLDYRYKTKAYLGGKVSDGVLEGNLIIEGGGDPTLGTKQAKEGADFIAAVVKALKKKKVNAIQGQVVIDASIFPGPATPPSWKSGDLPHSYGTGCHGFNWQHNAVGKSAVKDPQSKFKSQLAGALRGAGIELRGDTLDKGKHGKPIVALESEPVSEIMRYCMKESDNLYAEAFLRTTAVADGKKGTTDNGAEVEMRYWAKKGSSLSGVQILDGSGLSRSNRMTARFMADVLVKMSSNADFASFMPLAGIEGTLKNFLKGTPLEDYIALKTGSMNGIQCYAGYMLDDDYAPTHAVVIMVNDMPLSRGELREAVKAMLLEIFFPE